LSRIVASGSFRFDANPLAGLNNRGYQNPQPGKAQHVTTHYSAPEIGALIEASEKVCELELHASPAISVVRSRA